MPQDRTSHEELLRLLHLWEPLDEKDAFPEIEDPPPEDVDLENWETPSITSTEKPSP